MKHANIKAVFVVLLLCFFTASCTARMHGYYEDKSNYISATGTVDRINYDEDSDGLYFLLSGLSSEFDTDAFRIVGDNVRIVEARGIYEKIEIGDSIAFVTAPRYFGDGYILPIVAISTSDGEELLSFEEGLPNFLERVE